ncbi:MAG: hypothetical protein QOF24_1980 [Verrucomicrobiota bacterium]
MCRCQKAQEARTWIRRPHRLSKVAVQTRNSFLDKLSCHFHADRRLVLGPEQLALHFLKLRLSFAQFGGSVAHGVFVSSALGV